MGANLEIKKNQNIAGTRYALTKKGIKEHQRNTNECYKFCFDSEYIGNWPSNKKKPYYLEN